MKLFIDTDTSTYVVMVGQKVHTTKYFIKFFKLYVDGNNLCPFVVTIKKKKEKKRNHAVPGSDNVL